MNSKKKLLVTFLFIFMSGFGFVFMSFIFSFRLFGNMGDFSGIRRLETVLCNKNSTKPQTVFANE